MKHKMMALAGLAFFLSGATYVATKTPSYILDGTIQIDLTHCDGGVCTGTLVGGLFTPAAAPVDAGVWPDAAPLADAQPLPAPTPGRGIVVPPNFTPGIRTAQLAIASIAKPAVLASATDPVFGTSARRLLAKGSHDYSQLQPWTEDMKFILLIEDGFGYTVYNYPSMTQVSRMTGVTSPRWLPHSHKLLYAAASPARYLSYDFDTKAVATHATLAYPYQHTAETQEQPSDSWWTAAWAFGAADNKDHFLAVNLTTGKTGADLIWQELFAVGGPCIPDPQWGPIPPDWIAPSPGSKYLAIQWKHDGPTRCSGIELFDITSGAFVRQISERHDHSDHLVSTGGREGVETVVGASILDNNNPALVVHWLDGNPGPANLPTWSRTDKKLSTSLVAVSPWGTFGNIGCTNAFGVCAIDGQHGAWPPGPVPPFEYEIHIAYLDGSQQRLFHHRTTGCAGYWDLPRPAMCPTGKCVIFDSDWGTCNGGTSPYVIDF